MSRPFPSSPLWPVIDWLGDKTAIPEAWSLHLFSVQIGFFDRRYDGAFDVLRVWYKDPPSLFMNGVVFVQVRSPFWVGVGLRFSATHFLQAGLGFKGNGRWAMGFWWVLLWPVLFYLFGWHGWYLVLLAMIRIQTDESAAAGMDGPNYGQATGLMDGPK